MRLVAYEADILRTVRERGQLFIDATRDKATIRRRRLAIRRLTEAGMIEPVHGNNGTVTRITISDQGICALRAYETEDRNAGRRLSAESQFSWSNDRRA